MTSRITASGPISIALRSASKPPEARYAVMSVGSTLPMRSSSDGWPEPCRRRRSVSRSDGLRPRRVHRTCSRREQASPRRMTVSRARREPADQRRSPSAPCASLLQRTPPARDHTILDRAIASTRRRRRRPRRDRRAVRARAPARPSRSRLLDQLVRRPCSDTRCRRRRAARAARAASSTAARRTSRRPMRRPAERRAAVQT